MSASFDRDHSVLLLVDMQLDFLPGGALAVPGGEELIEPLAGLMSCGLFRFMVATQDWHSTNHISFASSHAGQEEFSITQLYGHDQVLWPDHCVAGSRGAELTGDLPWQRVNAILRKGSDPKVDSYSAFRDNWNIDGERPHTGMYGYLTDLRISDVYVCGLARDYCVQWTAMDAADLGLNTSVIWNLTRAVDDANDGDVRESFCARGISIIDSDALTSSSPEF